MSIIERLQDPELFVKMTLGEKMSGALIVMVLGIATCLIVLALIMVMVQLMHAAMQPKTKKKNRELAEEKSEIDAETAAVIVGAVAEMEGDRPFNVVSIREKEQ